MILKPRNLDSAYLPIVKQLGWNRCIRSETIHRSLRIYGNNQDKVEVYYAPLKSEYTKHSLGETMVLFLGLTPGRVQAVAAYKEHFFPNPNGSDGVSFLKQMRSNLIRTMDTLNLPSVLGFDSTALLFEKSHKHLSKNTSLLRYPVFVSGKNYNGSPFPSEHPFLSQMISEIFIPVITSLNDKALIVPFGTRVEEQVQLVAKRLGSKFERRCLFGFPHMSGANNGRIAEYLRGPLPEQHRKQIRKVLA